jgi:excisionase family DNA binding protein
MDSHEVSALSPSPRTLFTVDEAAEYLRVSRRQVYKLVRAGEIRGYRVGERLRFRPQDVDVYLEQRREPVR